MDYDNDDDEDGDDDDEMDDGSNLEDCEVGFDEVEFEWMMWEMMGFWFEGFNLMSV